MMIPYTKHSEIFHKYVFGITLECHLAFGRGKKQNFCSIM